MKAVQEVVGIRLGEGAEAVLRDLPEVCGVGREVDGVKAEAGHYLVRFWPLLCQGDYEQWELGPSCLYDINTTAEEDPKHSSGTNGTSYFSRVVRLRMGEDGTYGARGLHAHAYDPGELSDRGLKAGGVCRGTASFMPEPFAAALQLRMWHVQSVENLPQTSKHRSSVVKWWQEEGEEWLQRWAVPQAIVVPSAYGAKLKVARVVPLEMEWVRRMREGEKGKPYPYLG